MDLLSLDEGLLVIEICIVAHGLILVHHADKAALSHCLLISFTDYVDKVRLLVIHIDAHLLLLLNGKILGHVLDHSRD